ncbi:hypothetical protein N657DRAFT_578874 [Parathielavia appendiculata]|uniref:Uncharacterized protein n=1 Tax=Parathielavia appendiculata TaxID=2587402 RepID=A0AAN6TV45_9PEZI|nr:hypothetical protein N657DRAFT_578874 [Parathielavia appendiculata]
MKNWRELGEVPDSDDESFDDAEFHDHDQLDQFPGVEEHETQAEEVHTGLDRDGDICSVPSSSPDHAATSRTSNPAHASQMLSQPSWPAQSTLKPSEWLSTPRTPLLTAKGSFLEDDVSIGYVRLSTPGSRASSPASLLSKTPSLPRSPSLPQTRRDSPQEPGLRPMPVEGLAEELSRQTAVRLERSLRPRKPIQQHPYLLENAKYTNIMKSHGVKPIKVISEHRPARRTLDEEDSQDQGFQPEDSQEASVEGLGGLEEAGPILFDDDEDELAITPSLPKTSPYGQQVRTSSQQSNGDQTDATSLSDEEFPPLEKLRLVSAKKRRQSLKRQRSRLLSSTKRKRPRTIPDSSSQPSPQGLTFTPPPPVNIWELSSSPSGSQRPEELSDKQETAPQSPTRKRSRTPSISSLGNTSTASLPDNGTAASPIVINEDTQSNLSEGELTGSTGSSGSDSDMVRKNSRRIRGVLPASWLRLDQRHDTRVAWNVKRKTPEHSPERGVRRGVALPRQRSPKPSSTTPLIFFDEAESSGSENEPPLREPAANRSMQPGPAVTLKDEDDGASIVEEDTIDWMLPGRKRAGSHSTSGRAKKQKRSGTQAVFKGRPNWHARQPKITQLLGRSKHIVSTPTTKDSINRRLQKERGPPVSRKYKNRAATPPLLSILDVIEPDAPRFVKIAARAVKRKSNLGKASPFNKLISLATRSDNVDALSVLRDWKAGKMKPRMSVPLLKQLQEQTRRPMLREVSSNPASRPREVHPQKLVWQNRLDSFVLADHARDLQAHQVPPVPRPQPLKPLQDRRPDPHPAQLEEDEDKDKRRQLNSRKRTLDAFYRRARKLRGVSTVDTLGQEPEVDFNLRERVIQEQDNGIHSAIEETLASTEGKKRGASSRFRKRRRPQFVDLEAAQYACAHDPLPADVFGVEVQEDQHPPTAKTQDDKLNGLGPYGTHYSHHFEVFPLGRGVFFHESTVIGRGFVRDAADASLSDRTRHQRPTVSFSFDGRTLRWGAWDDNTSSQLGVLVDWIAEQVVSSTIDDGRGRKAIEAADFILGYILRSLSVSSDLEERAFLSRCLDVFSALIARFESIDWSTCSGETKRTQLEVLVRFSLAILAVRSLSQSSSSDPLQSTRFDGMLIKSASTTIRRLLEYGTEELQALYGDLQRPTFRERGIRSDRFLANCWVVTMRVLECAAIPRSSFWDVTQSVMFSQGIASPLSAQVLERFWRDMFTLLPLSEIDNNGVVVSGMRHTAPLEGWALPQQLLKRVFQLYQANPRQPPGFNDYCRALVARCHFLVQQWGWCRCTGIIGTIFDFFGSQSLAHLRNEEVYKSPRFLEELDRQPSLSIEPEDRCFHVFIKLLALAIQRLRSLGRVNDIKNLVARTLPNHNRQYLKENTIHQHDLAALRNHHDLLCMLFWVSPPDLRPAVHLIEKLVVPASAHKEACLINVRAWNQLARFVMSNGEGGEVFRPLAAWRNNVFNQVLDQYLSAASDIEQQFRALSSEIAGISKQLRDEMVAKNKATALDVLHFSVKASLDVLQRAPTLEAALYGLNTTQLQKVFTSLDYQSSGFDWSILRVAMETVEHLIGRIDQASEEQYSSEFSENPDASYLEDAVLLMNEHLAKDFFWLCRTILSLPVSQSSRQHNHQVECAEKAVTLAARIASRFIKNRVTKLLPFFSPGKYGLFSDVPKHLTTQERKYIPLFLAVLVKDHVFDLKDLGMNILGLWILSVVKPMRYLGYENYLAEVLRQRNLPFLERATVAVGIPPDYNSNLDYFACAMHYMRKTLRECGSAQSKMHRDEFSKTLQLAMQKIREDLSLLRPHTTEHGLYINFVRQVISLIKSHGVGICAVDPFFTQPSVDYSPPVQDPQLHMAGIIAYGVRLSEKDVTAPPQLFHYLFNNFKIALGNDTLDQECRILGTAMRNAHVTSFMLHFMIPAIIQASAQVPDCWALLEVYTAALREILESGCAPRELQDDDVEHAAGVLDAILAWLEGLRGAEAGATLSLAQLHVMTLLATTANSLQPSLSAHLFNNHEADCNPGLQDAMDRLTAFFDELSSQIEDVLLCRTADEVIGGVSAATLLGGLRPPSSQTLATNARNPRVQNLASTIVADVRRNWVVSADRVMVRMALASSGRAGGLCGVPILSQAAVGSSGGGAAASLRGARYGPWEERGLLERLWGAVSSSRWGMGGGGRRVRRDRMREAENELLF